MSTLTLPRRMIAPIMSRTNPGAFLKRYGLLCLFLLTASAMTVAGTDTTFDGVVNLITGWATGSLGKLFAIAAFVVGMAIGIIRQSVMAIVIGIGVGLTMFYGPGIINSVVSFAI